MPRIASIYRYPIKGLSPERVPRAALEPGQTVPGDRLYAIENGPSGFDPAKPYLPKTRFLMLMKNERLATLCTSFDQATHVLTIEFPSSGGRSSRLAEDGGKDSGAPPSDRGSAGPASADLSPQPGEISTISADLRSPEGRATIEHFFAQFCADELRGPPRILHAPGHSFSDVARKVVSIINLASVGAIEEMIGGAVNPLRLRGNVYVEGWPAWTELDLVGRQLTIGDNARLKIVKRIVRCPATNVDPDTGVRDLELPQTLMRHLGHADCGIYGEVIEGGEIAAGDDIQIM